MSDNRSEDIKLIKLAIKIEKDTLAFFDRFIQKAGESSLGTFLQTVQAEQTEDVSRIEQLLQPLEAESGSGDNLEGLSLDEYAKEHGSRGDKFFTPSRVSELLDGFYNPIQTLGAAAQIMKEIAKFYQDRAADIFYDTEKAALLEFAEHKKEQSDTVGRKKREIISRFP